jgi:hypothetical protein
MGGSEDGGPSLDPKGFVKHIPFHNLKKFFVIFDLFNLISSSSAVSN